MRLILASASPRRAELLRAAGYDFEVIVADVDEQVRRGEPPREYVRRLAVEKAARVFERLAPDTRQGGALVIAADTSVIVDDDILGKPADPAAAAQMLRRLSGRRHVVMTGVAFCAAHFRHDLVEETTVEMAVLGDQQVEWYVSSREGDDKAGGYAIQGLASRFVTRIEGSYANVVGLPVARIDEVVRAAAAPMRAVASDPY